MDDIDMSELALIEGELRAEREDNDRMRRYLKHKRTVYQMSISEHCGIGGEYCDQCAKLWDAVDEINEALGEA